MKNKKGEISKLWQKISRSDNPPKDKFFNKWMSKKNKNEKVPIYHAEVD